MASGINSTFRQVGIATGIAVWGAIFEHRAVSAFEAATGLPATANLILFGGVRANRASEAAFVAGLDRILVLGAIVAFAGAALAAVLIRSRDFVTAEEPGEQMPAAA